MGNNIQPKHANPLPPTTTSLIKTDEPCLVGTQHESSSEQLDTIHCNHLWTVQGIVTTSKGSKQHHVLNPIESFITGRTFEQKPTANMLQGHEATSPARHCDPMLDTFLFSTRKKNNPNDASFHSNQLANLSSNDEKGNDEPRIDHTPAKKIATRSRRDRKPLRREDPRTVPRGKFDKARLRGHDANCPFGVRSSSRVSSRALTEKSSKGGRSPVNTGRMSQGLFDDIVVLDGVPRRERSRTDQFYGDLPQSNGFIPRAEMYDKAIECVMGGASVTVAAHRSVVEFLPNKNKAEDPLKRKRRNITFTLV